MPLPLINPYTGLVAACRGDSSNDAPFELLLLFLPEYFLVDVLAGYFLVLLVVVCEFLFLWTFANSN